MPRRIGRPVDEAKVQALVAAAWPLFLERGVAAVTMEMIAKAAGTSKVTAYRHFDDKHDVFRAGVLRAMEEIEQSQALELEGLDARSLQDRLLSFGQGLLTFLHGQSSADFYAVLVSELRADAGLARSFHEVGPGRTRANLVGMLTQAVSRGEMACPDPELAAEQFLGLLQGFSNYEIALGLADPMSGDAIRQRALSAVEALTTLYPVAR